MPPIGEHTAGDPRRRIFFLLNGLALALVVLAAALAYLAGDPRTGLGVAALVLVILGIGLAIASYPFYRHFMRQEIEARRAAAAERKRRI